MTQFRSAFDIGPADEPEPERADTPPDGVPAPRKRGRPAGAKNKPAPSREDTKHIGGQFRVQVSTELQMICIEREARTGQKHTVQGLLGEGINHVLRKEGRQPIAREK